MSATSLASNGYGAMRDFPSQQRFASYGKMEGSETRLMANRTTLTQEQPAKAPKAVKKAPTSALGKAADNHERERIFDAFRRWGYLEANLDPLGVFQPLKHPDLEGLTGDAAEEARRIYCGTIGADFMH